MSKTVDQRVVEMRFDNQHFEKNVQTTMSTLDKFKQKLNLKGAAKGLDDVNSAAKKIDMSNLGRGVEAVSAKFSALQVMGVTALANITNSAVNAGKKIASALTIDPIKTGLSEYETKMNAIQVIQANTRGKNTMSDITAALDELNTYADKTIYNFAQMTSNIGKFTAQGFDVQKATDAVKGMANLAAASGASAEDMSRATYQMSQALGGYIKLMDWNSLRNANMATVELKNTLIALAKVHGIAIDEMIEKEGTFEQTLSQGWLSGEMFSEAMNIYSGVYSEAELKAKGFTDSQIKNFQDLAATAESAATEVKTITQLWDVLKETAQSGWTQTWELIIGDFETAKKTLTQVQIYFSDVINKFSDKRNNILKGALGSSWDTLAEKITKAGLSTETFTDMLSETLKEAGVSVDDLVDKYGSLTEAIRQGKVKAEYIVATLKRLIGVQDEAAESVDAVTMSAEELEKVVNRVLGGEFGNGEARIKALTEAGYDYATVQNKVNELLGSSVRHTSELTDEQKEMMSGLAKLSDEQLKSKGYTEEQIKALRDLEEMAKLSGASFDDLMKKMERPSGRDLLIDSFINIKDSLVEIFTLIGEAWTNIFGEKTEEEQSQSIYNIIEKFHELTESMAMSEETANNFKTVMEGVFAGMKIGGTLASKTLIGGLKLLNAVLNLFGTDILGAASKVAEYIIQFNDWIEGNTLFGYDSAYDKLAEVLVRVYNGIKKCVVAFMGLEKVQGLIEKVTNLVKGLFGAFDGAVDFFKPGNFLQSIDDFFTKLESWIKGIDSAENVGEYIIDGILNGLNKAATKLLNAIRNILVRVWSSLGDFFGRSFEFKSLGANVIDGLYEGMGGGLDKLFDIAKQVFLTIYNTIANLFEIHSPSKVMIALGGFIIAGLIAGLTGSSGELDGSITGIGSKLLEGFQSVITMIVNGIKEIDFGDILAVGLSGGLIYALKKLGDALELFGNPLDQLAGMFKAIKNIFNTLHTAVEDWAKAQKYNAIGKMVLNMAISLGILVGAVIALCYVIDKLDLDWKVVTGSVIAIAALAGVLLILAKACESLNSIGKVSLNTVSLVGMALSLVLVAGALKLLSGILPEDIQTTLILFTGMVVGLGILLAAVSKIVGNIPDGGSIKGLGKVFTKLAWSLLIMIGVIKLASMLKAGEIIKGTIVIGLIGLFYAAVVKMAKGLDSGSMKYVQRLGSLMTRIAWSLLLMIGVIKLASMLTVSEIAKGSAVILAISVFFGAFTVFAKLLGEDAENISKIGNYMLKVSVALLLTTFAIKMVAGMSLEDIAKGVGVIYAIGGLFGALTYISKYGGKNASKAGLMLIEMATAMLILSAVLIILKDLDSDGIIKALGIMTYFTVLFGGLIAITKFAGKADNVKGTLISLTVAIAVLTIALVALSMLDSKKVAIASGCLSLVIGMFALLIKATSSLKTGAKSWKRTLITLGVLTALVVGLAVVIFALSSLKPERALASAGALGILLLSLSSAFLIITKSKSLARKNLVNIYATLGVLTLITFALAGAIAVLQNVNPTNAIGAATGLGILLNALASAFLIITKSKSLSKKNMDNMLATIGMLALVTVALSVAILILKDVDPLTAVGAAIGLGILLNALSASLVVLSNSKSISKSKLPSLLTTLLMLTLVTGALGGVINTLKDCDPLTSIGNAIALSLLLGMLSAAFDTLAKSKSISAAKLPGMIATLGMLTIVTGLLAVIIKKLSDCNPLNSIGNAIALSLLIGVLTLLTIPLSTVGKRAGSAVKGALALTSMVIPLAAFAYAIYKLPEISDAQINSVIMLTQVMTAMTLLLIPLTILGNFAVSALAGIIALTAMVVPLYAFATIISQLPDVTGARESVIILTQVMTAMTLLLVPLTLIGVLAPFAALGIAALTAMVIPLKTFANSIVQLPDVTSSLATITILMSVLDKMTDILMKVTPLAPLALVGVVAIEAMVLVIGAFGVFATAIGALMEKFPSLEEFLYKGIDILVGIGEGLGRVMGSFITGFGEEVLSLLPTLGQALSGFMVGAMPFINGIKLVDESVLENVKILASAILVLAVADFVSSVIGFNDNSEGMINAAVSLNSFIATMIPTLMMLSTIDSSVIESVGVLADAILKLTAADLISSISSFLGMSLDLDDFATRMAGYGKGVAAFNNAIKDANIDEDAVNAAANAGKIMAELQSAIEPMGGVVQFFTGEKNLEDFGLQLKAYGKALAEFSKTVSADGAINEDAITAAANAGKIMTELQSAIEPTDGVWQWLAGTTSLDTFGSQLKAYGEAIVAFSGAVSAEGAINEDAVGAANRVGEVMSALQKNLPEDKWLDGKMNLAQFGEKIAKFGGYIADYASSVAEINVEKVNASTGAAKTLGAIAKSAADIDPDTVSNFECISTIGESMKSYASSVAEMDPTIVSSSISSANRLRNFIASLVDLDNSGVDNFRIGSIGTTMKSYSNSVKDLDPFIVSSSISSANRLRNFIASLVNLDSSGISNFRLSAIGNSIKTYATSVAGIDTATVSSSISIASRLKNFISSLAGLDASGVGSFTSAVSKLGQVSIDSFVKAFSGSSEKLSTIGGNLITSLIKGATSKKDAIKTSAIAIINSALNGIKSKKDSFKTAGSTLITQLANGIKSKKSTATKAVSDIVSSAADKADDGYDDFYSAGSSLVDGFVAGISDNSFKAAAKAAAMASAAYEAAKEALDINSPSKVFRSLGTSVPEGFAMGIGKFGNLIKDASVGMADTAVNGLTGAISRISDIVNGEIDAQPVIRPVLDLSEVQSGAGSINGLFGMTPSVGVMSNIRAINSMMNRNQNGANDDVVSAIDKLRGDLGNVRGDTYMIGDVNYGADSEVASAIQTLVRAAMVERRV